MHIGSHMHLWVYRVPLFVSIESQKTILCYRCESLAVKPAHVSGCSPRGKKQVRMKRSNYYVGMGAVSVTARDKAAGSGLQEKGCAVRHLGCNCSSTRPVLVRL